eukprot:CAMPEP_0185725128 /NCGR_PEP_ID=MMETSP1171-20130828/1450_1 /TAXON_ID=374046 /ORGANISM="Helicotheca tamensis, Strain CCMP826" /LENGTH=300 /DNA_ID=CAMNT_0028393165 /DNA_START=53 /DNA_END=955 /DNA_ORIENTATION=-
MTSTSNATSTASAKNRKVMYTRRVKFFTTTKAHVIPGLSEMSEDEKTATWMMDADYARLQLTILKTVKRMRQGKELNEEKYCARGLEHMGTADLLKQKEDNKLSVRNAILTEQYRQKIAGCYDDEKLRKISLLHSRNPRLAALQRGTSAAAVEGFVVESCHARIMKDQGDTYYSARQSIGEGGCISVSENDNSKHDADSANTNQVNISDDEPCSPNRGLFRSWQSDASYTIGTEEEQDTSHEHISSTNVFNSVLFKISRGLEGEKNDDGHVCNTPFQNVTAQSNKLIDITTQRRFVPNSA